MSLYAKASEIKEVYCNINEHDNFLSSAVDALLQEFEDMLPEEILKVSTSPYIVPKLLVSKKLFIWSFCIFNTFYNMMVKIRGRILLRREGMMRIMKQHQSIQYKKHGSKVLKRHLMN